MQLTVCAVTGIRYLIEGVIWQRLPGFANAKPFLLVTGMRCIEGLTAGKKAYERGAVN